MLNLCHIIFGLFGAEHEQGFQGKVLECNIFDDVLIADNMIDTKKFFTDGLSTVDGS